MFLNSNDVYNTMMKNESGQSPKPRHDNKLICFAEKPFYRHESIRSIPRLDRGRALAFGKSSSDQSHNPAKRPFTLYLGLEQNKRVPIVPNSWLVPNRHWALAVLQLPRRPRFIPPLPVVTLRTALDFDQNMTSDQA